MAPQLLMRQVNEDRHDSEMRQHEARHHQGGQHEEHVGHEMLHQAEALETTTSILDAENDTPERSAMVQV